MVLDRGVHLLDGDVGRAAPADGIGVAQRARHAVHVAELLHRAPALVPRPPLRAGRQPDGERLGEILVRVLLRVPARDVPHEAARERDGPVVLAVGAAERSEQRPPFRLAVEPVGVVEGVARLVAHVHHDLAGVLEIVHFLFELRELGVGEVEGDADHRLPGGAAPLVGEVEGGSELPEALALQLAVQALDGPFDGRPFQLEAEILDRLGQDLLDVQRGLFKGGHSGRGGSNPSRGPPHAFTPWWLFAAARRCASASASGPVFTSAVEAFTTYTRRLFVSPSAGNMKNPSRPGT